ncbi:hypothetical protein [uncultured Polaribacter sp.]|uniref:hypothetical protein n=1 Tax=uncultured Polaribacter sp. TaxID=174711 RepID=UPI002635B6B4|nr:hypothetical protein [uncultured Polaribacter sp.]
MRKVVFICIAIISFNCKSHDIIEANKLTISQVKVLNQNKDIVIATFGQPLQITTEYSEMDDNKMYIYYYKGLKFYIINNLVESFEISSSMFLFTNYHIKVGDNISTLKNLFSNSFALRSLDYLKLDIKDSDMFLTIEFNSISNNISKINIGNY